MYFNHPYFLLLLVFPFALFIYSMGSKKQTFTSIFSPAVLKIISVNEQFVTNTLKYRLFLSVIILFIIALAQPFLKHSFSNKERGIPLVIALDISKSMLKDDFYPSRLEFALSKIETIMNSKVNLRVGLLLFADDAYVAHPLSEDKNSLLFIAKSIDYSKVIQNRTNLFAALEGATLMLKNYAHKNLLILSDIQEIQGVEESAYIKKNNLNVSLLSLAKTSNATTYSSDDIELVLNKVHKSVEGFEGKTQEKKKIQLFYIPLLFALFLLLFIYASDLEFKNRSVTLIFSLLLVSLSTQSKASILDFYHISNANTQYKQALYDKALKNYNKSLSNDALANAGLYYNIANTYVKLGQLHLAKKYYEKSLFLIEDKDARENLEQVKLIISNQKHKISKAKEEKYKLPQRISVGQKSQQETLSSDYVVSLEKIVLKEEEKILQKLKKQKPIIYLRKLDLHLRSKNVLQD